MAGILDCLINSNPAEARARAALMLLQADQVALDKGSWTLASEASLELAPPFHSFASHAAVDASDQPLSRLFEPRWAEIMLHHLRDTEDYVERKRKLGAKANRTQPSEGYQAEAKTLNPDGGPCMTPGQASSGATQGRLKVPGASAPVISVPGLANSMTRRVLSSRCDFASFLSDVTCLPGTSTSASPSVWPVPLPFPEVCRGHCSGATAWRKRYVNLAVVAMNWLFLSPRRAPAGLAAKPAHTKPAFNFSTVV